MITRGDFFMIKDMYKRGMSISDIARELELDRGTVRKYINSSVAPSKQKRTKTKSKLDSYKEYLHQRMLEDGVFNGERLLDEIKQLGYTGGKTILKDYIKPFRDKEKKKYSVRYETLPGEQMQVDWKEIGEIILNGERIKLSMFVATLGYSRMKYAEFTTSQDQEHVLQCLISSFKYFGGVPQKILFDNMRTVTDGREQGIVKWNARFAEFAAYYDFIPKACKPYRAKTKGKVERAIQYITNSFYVGTTFDSIEDINLQVERWLDGIGNRKKNDTTDVPPQERWSEEKLSSLPKINYDTSYRVYRKTHFDSTLSYKGHKWLLPKEFALKDILVKESLTGVLRFFYQGEEITAFQTPASVISLADQIKKKQSAVVAAPHSVPEVSVNTRPLSVYDDLLRGES
ncbi:IS21 family transposase [Bacillus sp. F19]|nr:IS21 family transposase [Bacillus sp. F19]